MASHYMLLIQSIEDMCLLAHVSWVNHNVLTGYTAFSVLWATLHIYTHIHSDYHSQSTNIYIHSHTMDNIYI